MDNDLRMKGWSERELEHLKQHPHSLEQRFLVLLALALATVVSLLIPYGYSHLAQVLTPLGFILTLFLLGGAIGILFGVFLLTLERVTHAHHALLILILSAAFLLLHNHIFSHSSQVYDTFIASFIYTIAFIIPYSILVLYSWISKNGQRNT